MAGFGPLILNGNLKVGATSGTAVDLSDEVTAFKISGARATIDIPRTLGSRKTHRAGADTYEITIAYLSSEIMASGSSLFTMLWNALADNAGTTAAPSGTLYFEGSMTDDAISAANPLYSGRFLVTGASIGGNADELSVDSQTFVLLDRPSISTTSQSTTIAVGSNGQSLPQATINVASTTGFASAGTIRVVTSFGVQYVAYTSVTSTTFTGCTGGLGAMSTGGTVTQ